MALTRASPIAGEVIDVTLREGLQAAAALFISDDDSLAYAQDVCSSGVADRLEIYRPGPRLSPNLFDNLQERLSHRLQLYVGPTGTVCSETVDWVKAHFRGEWLALTLLDVRPLEIGPLRRLRQECSCHRLRVGIECAAFLSMNELEHRIGLLFEMGVDRVVICDSNGQADPAWASKLGRRLARCNCPLGYHFHNDRGLALANTWAALEGVRTAGGSNPVSIDATFMGVGDRNGIVSLQELIRSGLRYMSDSAQDWGTVLDRQQEAANPELRLGTGRLVNVPTSNTAASHYSQGRLRPPYRRAHGGRP